MSKKHFVQKSPVLDTWAETLVFEKSKKMAPIVAPVKPVFRKPFMEEISSGMVHQFLNDKMAKDGPSCFNVIVCCNTPIGVLATIEAFKLRREGMETLANASKLPGGGLKTITEEVEALQNSKIAIIEAHKEDVSLFCGDVEYDNSFFNNRIQTIDCIIEKISSENCDVINFLKVGAAREFSEEMGGKFLSANFFKDEVPMRVFTRYVNGVVRVFVVFIITELPKILAFDAEREQMISRNVVLADFKLVCESVKQTSCDQIIGSMVLTHAQCFKMGTGFVKNCGWVASHAFITSQIFSE